MAIISQKPIVYPAISEKQYGEMKIKHFSITAVGGQTILRAHLINCNPEGENDPSENGFSLSLQNVEEQINLYPSLKLAWEKINEAIGLLYDYYYLEEEVRKATVDGQEAPELTVARDTAWTKLLATTTIEKEL